MRLFGYFAIVLCVVLTCFGEEPTTIPETDTTTTAAAATTLSPTTNTTISPGTTTTTLAPVSTTLAPVSTTTLSPGSTSLAPDTTIVPDTTTNVPDTTSQAPDTTSQAPDTTQAPVTTAKPPSPTVAPAQQYNVTENNVTCLVADFNVILYINYTTSDGNITIGEYDLPQTMNTTSSTCGNDTQTLVLNYDNGNKLTLDFTKTDDGKNFALSEVNFLSKNLTLVFANSTGESYNKSWTGSYLSAPIGFSYLCKGGIETNKMDGNYVKFPYIQAQAFGTKPETNFFTEKECDADMNDVSDIVPIAVGCALAGLVVIVLIAYLVGRRQKRQRGYESV